jgi:hypothetical protein
MSAKKRASRKSAKKRASCKVHLVSTDGFQLDVDGALWGDALCSELARLGFRVRRYGDQAGLDDEAGQGRVPALPVLRQFRDKQFEYSAALLELKAPQAPLPPDDEPRYIRPPDPLEQAKKTLGRLSGLGFKACLDIKTGALLIHDATGLRRDLSRFISVANVFDTLVAALSEDSELFNSPG